MIYNFVELKIITGYICAFGTKVQGTVYCHGCCVS